MPPLLMAQECSPPAVTWLKVPPGGELWPFASAPQQLKLPSLLTAQAWSPPAAIRLKVPFVFDAPVRSEDGGASCPARAARHFLTCPLRADSEDSDRMSASPSAEPMAGRRSCSGLTNQPAAFRQCRCQQKSDRWRPQLVGSGLRSRKDRVRARVACSLGFRRRRVLGPSVVGLRRHLAYPRSGPAVGGVAEIAQRRLPCAPAGDGAGPQPVRREGGARAGAGVVPFTGRRA